jgi:hypothetical protein
MLTHGARYVVLDSPAPNNTPPDPPPPSEDTYLLLLSNGTDRLLLANGTDKLLLGGSVADTEITGLTAVGVNLALDLLIPAGNAAGAADYKITLQEVISLLQKPRYVSGNTTAEVTDYKIITTDTSAARTHTLPALDDCYDGQAITFLDGSFAAGTNNITVQRAGADTFLDGSTSRVMTGDGDSLTVVAIKGSINKWGTQ